MSRYCSTLAHPSIIKYVSSILFNHQSCPHVLMKAITISCYRNVFIP